MMAVDLKMMKLFTLSSRELKKEIYQDNMMDDTDYY